MGRLSESVEDNKGTVARCDQFDVGITARFGGLGQCITVENLHDVENGVGSALGQLKPL